MADNDLTIQREVQLMSEELNRLSKSSRESSKELRDVNKYLKLDPTNTELLAEKTKILNDQLQNAKDRSAALSSEIQLLNSEKAKQAYTDEEITNKTAELNKQLTSTNREVTALTGATNQQAEANKAAEESTKSFSQSMTEFQSNLRAVRTVMRGVQSGFELLGGDKDSAMGKVIQQGQKVVQMMSGIASMGKLLGQSNTALGKTFGTVAVAAGAAIAGFSLGQSIINAFGEENRKTAAIITTVTGALVAASIAIAALNAFTRPWMLPVGLAALGVAAAGIVSLTKTQPTGDDTTTAITTVTPTIPTVSATTTDTIVGTQTTYGDQTININIYDAGEKTAEQIMTEINAQWRDRKLAYR